MKNHQCNSCRVDTCPIYKGLCDCLKDSNKASGIRNEIMYAEYCVIKENAKLYKCSNHKECNQYKRQGNKATKDCEGCGSLKVSVVIMIPPPQLDRNKDYIASGLLFDQMMTNADNDDLIKTLCSHPQFSPISTINRERFPIGRDIKGNLLYETPIFTSPSTESSGGINSSVFNFKRAGRLMFQEESKPGEDAKEIKTIGWIDYNERLYKQAYVTAICNATLDEQRKNVVFEITIDKLKLDEYVRVVAHQISTYVGTKTKIMFVRSTPTTQENQP